ncbi:MAG: hypothetical protein QE285_01090 [Aquabacterium sp.]|nr:hypothetical protein [Aquabacterium sp.]
MTLDDTHRQPIALLRRHGANGRWNLLAALRADGMAEASRRPEPGRLTTGIRHTETGILLPRHR